MTGTRSLLQLSEIDYRCVQFGTRHGVDEPLEASDENAMEEEPKKHQEPL